MAHPHRITSIGTAGVMTGRLARLLAAAYSPWQSGRRSPSGVSIVFPLDNPPLPIASDVPDLGTASTLAELWTWCNRNREMLRQFRIELARPALASVAVDEFRVIPEVVHQCKALFRGLCATEIPECFRFAGLPRDQSPTDLEPGYRPSEMEAFLIWASQNRSGTQKLLGDVEEFLTWTMEQCHQANRPNPPPPAGPSAENQPAEAGPRVNKKRRPSVNARMLETIQADPGAMGWTSSKWAKHLKCVKSSVVATETWKNMQMVRERNRAERAQDRRRRPKGSDQNRD